MLTAIRSWPRRRRREAAWPRSWRGATTASSGRSGCSPRSPRRASSMPGPRGWSRSCAESPRRSPASRCRRRRPTARRRRRSTPCTRSSRATATARSSSSRASASTPTRSKASSRAIGDSLLVVGDPSALKVHVHTDDPGRALSLGVARGAIAGVEIADMHSQTIERRGAPAPLGAEPRRPPARVVAVAAGAGNRRLLETLGALVVDGGRTMNPSTAEILAVVEIVARAVRSSCCRTTRTSGSPPSTPRRTRPARSACCRRPRCRPGSPRRSRSTPSSTRPRTSTRWARRPRPSRRAP